MAFETLSDRLKLVAVSSLAFCRREWGSKGLKIEEQIDTKIGWRPTFYLRPSPVLIKAVEVSDSIFPETLRIAAADLDHYDFPVSIYQACSLDVYQHDPRLQRVNHLRARGFGLITVDDTGGVYIQIPASPIAQFISLETFENEITGLNGVLRVKFNSAYATYQTNVEQGVQEAGQIIEAMINCMTSKAVAAGFVASKTSQMNTAQKIDALYASQTFQKDRAALGAARNFISNARNPASHPPSRPKQAADRLKKCRNRFLEAARICLQLRSVCQRLKFQIRLT